MTHEDRREKSVPGRGDRCLSAEALTWECLAPLMKSEQTCESGEEQAGEA